MAPTIRQPKMPIFVLVFLLLLLTENPSSAQTYTNISLGTTFSPLTNPSSWPSPSGDFAFGFRPLDSDPSLYLLAVWYPKIPARTVVWSANGPNPVTNRSTAILTADGRLILNDVDGQAGQVTVWNAGVNTASYASMLDTGNFVLSSSGAGPIWQTFDNPTDTILPGQSLKQVTSVYARLMDDDYSQGRFELAMQDDGNLVLYAVAYPTKFRYRPAYWASSTFGTGIHLVFSGTGSVDVVLANDSKVPVLAAPAVSGDNYLRATLDPDGAFRQYAYGKSSKLSTGSWTVTNSLKSDSCDRVFSTGSGYCGYNSYCVPNADGRPNCHCPPNYSPLNPARDFEGCKPDFPAQPCEPGGEATFSLARVAHLNWPMADADQLSPMNETECAASCLKDCFCWVAIYNGQVNNGTCWKKRFPFSNGRMVGEASEITIAFVKYSNSSASPGGSTQGGSDWKTWFVVVSAILCGSVVLILVLAGACCFVLRRQRRVPPPSYSGGIGPALRAFAYKELEEATGGFSEELGRGAFGTVYKGFLPSRPRTPIAVKKLDGSMLEEAEKDFANEVSAIGQTHHKNLVRLLGFCKEGEHRLMVFEFMSHGSLNKFLFRTAAADRPEWNRRVQIALGIAGGLAYLHEECRTQIIHCDIKPQNILLDDNLEARISDFGLAKLLRLEQTRTSTGIRGTIGYFAPEWFKNVAVTTKVDVYSFGVMLLEMVCCRRNFEWGPESQERATVVDWAKECYMNGRLDLLVEDDEEAKRDGMRLERLVMVGICCVQEEPWLRPSMKKVVQMLEGSIAVSIPPNMYTTRS